MLLHSTMPGGASWAKAHPPGARSEAQAFAPGWDPGYTVLGRVDWSLGLTVIVFGGFEPLFVWLLTQDQIALGDPTRSKLPQMGPLKQTPHPPKVVLHKGDLLCLA